MTPESGNQQFKILMAASKKWDTPGFSNRPSTVLFLVYINPMTDKIASKIYLFADDAKLYVPVGHIWKFDLEKNKNA